MFVLYDKLYCALLQWLRMRAGHRAREPGEHEVVRHERREQPPEALLSQAARLSDSRRFAHCLSTIACRVQIQVQVQVEFEVQLLSHVEIQVELCMTGLLYVVGPPRARLCGLWKGVTRDGARVGSLCFSVCVSGSASASASASACRLH